MIRKHTLPILIAVILTTLLVLYLSRVGVPDCRLASGKSGSLIESNVVIYNGNGD